MIEIYLLTETIDAEEEKQAELIGKEYKPELKYTKSWLNPEHIELVISHDKEDVYIIQFSNTEGEIIAKIHKDEISKLSQR